MSALLDREPRDMLALLAGQVLGGSLQSAPAQQVTAPQTDFQRVSEPERRPGDDPYLITEDEFSYRVRVGRMSHEEQKILRCRVNAARAHKNGWLDDARKFRQQADRLERKLHQAP